MNGLETTSKCGKFYSNLLRNNMPTTGNWLQQEAQLPQTDSSSATHVFLGSLTDRALHWAPYLFYNCIID